MNKATIESVIALEEKGKYKAIAKTLSSKNDDYELIPVKKQAINALQKSGDKRYIKVLIEALNNSRSSIRIAAANALGDLCDANAFKSLILALNDESELVTIAAINSLVKYDNILIIPVMVKMLERDDIIQLAALNALGKLGSKEQANDVIMCIGSHMKKIRVSTANTLYKLGETKWKDIIKGDNDDFHRLAATNDYRLIKVFINELYYTRTNSELIKKVLVEIQHDKKVDILLNYLCTDVEIVKGFIIEILGEIGDKKAVQPLIDEYQNNEDTVTKSQILKSLAKIGDHRSIECFKAELSHNNPTHRIEAAELLGKFKCDESVDLLIKALSDNNQHVVMRSADSLKEIGDDKAILSLIDALGGEDKIAEAQNRKSTGRRLDMQGRVNRSILDALRELGYEF